MAFQASTSALRRIRPRIAQWESVTGRRIPPSLLRQWLEAELSVEAGRAIQSRALDIQQEFGERRLELLEEQIESEAGAAKIAGIGELAIGGATLAPAIGKGLKTIGTQLGITGGATAAGATTLPAIIPGGAAIDPLLLNMPSAVGGGTAAPTAGTGLGAGFQSLALPAAAGFVGGKLGEELGRQQFWQEITPWGGAKTERKIGGVLGGAAAGFMVGGPIGAVIGGIVGFVGGTK